ncbi:hypothetical protein J2S20_000425 [Moryella indoligenes]|uniref:Uncharacterized protein n=1 Tax=Moryella indoligenes TaxID=371674 RepID=A0AAE3V9E4_9FIRM|nr:hypothetical protein [Moryella indoligenes]MDQ0151745.1 hypothetical protein [Moryella indoligenes]
MISNLFIKFYLDASISRYIFIVKIFLEKLLNFFTTSRRSACGAGCPDHPRDRPPAGDTDPRQPGWVSLENPAKIKKNQDIT